MLGGVQALLEDRLDRRLLAAHQGGRIEPEAGKHRAAKDAIGRRGHQLESPFAVHEPVDLAVEDPPDDILAHAVSAVGVELLPQVVTDAAGGDFRDQLGRSLDVIILADAGLSPMFGQDDQEGVGLGFVVQVQADGAVIARLDPGRVRFINSPTR